MTSAQSLGLAEEAVKNIERVLEPTCEPTSFIIFYMNKRNGNHINCNYTNSRKLLHRLELRFFYNIGKRIGETLVLKIFYNTKKLETCLDTKPF